MFRNRNPKPKDESNEVASEHPSGIPREAMEAPPGPIGAVLLNRVRNFLASTGIETQFRHLLRVLLSREELPYNPYPGFAVRLRPFMEKFLTDADTDAKIEYALSVPLRETRLLNLFTVQDGGPVWGLRSILRVVDAPIINKYRWLADSITPGYDDLYQKEGYSNQVMLALVGAAIFHGSFYHQVHIAQYRQEFLITGGRADEAVSIFVNSVVMDVDSLISSTYHTLIGVNVPVRPMGENPEEIWLLEFWDPQNIQAHKGELMQKMSDAVLGSNYIIAECVFQLEPNRPIFIQGQKQYSLNFVEAVDELREEGLSSFAEFPMASLHEGLFLNQTHAESYISMFTPQTDMLDAANVKHMSARPARHVADSAGGAAGTRRSSAVVEDDYHYIHRHVHQRLQHHRPRRARIDGFRLGGEDPGSGPFAWQVTTPFKSHLQRRVVTFHPWAQLFDIVYHMIILVLMERKTTDVPLLIELYRLCHSTAGKLHMVGERNKAVRALIRGFLNRTDSERVKKFLADYKNDVDEILAYSLHERSSDLQAVGRAISGQVTDLMSVSDEEFRTPSYLNMVILTLRDQHSFMVTTLMRLAEDMLHWCPLLKNQIDQLHQIFTEYVPRPASNTRDPEMAGPRDRLPKSVTVRHGFENEHILKHEHSTIVVAKCMEREPSPKVIAKEAVLMRYMVDTHLDETWEKFLEESFQQQQPPLNPYPSFITKCRACAMKMDLFFEPEQNILERLLTKNSSLVDADNFIYQVPGCEACGPATAVSVLDPGAYVPAAQCIRDHLTNKAYIHRKGPYRIGICLGLTGPCALYGKMLPYLCLLELHEHYYIQGPAGCEGDAAQLFAVMIQKHIWELVSAGKVAIIGVYVGRDKIRWSWEEIINKKLGFFTEVESTVLNKEPIYLKAYVLMDGWRYVPVLKHFLLHFMREGDQGTDIFFDENPLDFYTTVFTSKERAAFHYQNGGPLRGGNPLSSSNMRAVLAYMDQKLLQLKARSNFVEVHRLLLFRSLIANDTSHVVEAWRMFHSMAVRAEYVSSLAQSLADLVEFELEFAKFSSVDVSTITPDDGRDTASAGFRKGGSPVNLGVVSTMLTALLDQARVVAGERVSMLANSLPDYLAQRLSTVIEKDRRTGYVYPIIDERTIMTLEEVAHMFLNVKATIGCDVHNAGDNALATFADIEGRQEQRPTSVDSQILNDPQVFQRRPRAGRKILEDDMLYRPRVAQLYKPRVEETGP